ncbi:MAG: sigma-54 dependent transcriptional regulator [Sphingobacteriales bacterium JAD_PAG50586_3]|nr:MAG: sigma-54 dependent transcriptional regulator [Sphingobacteriales bacterium JAD_PAG50586_3]
MNSGRVLIIEDNIDIQLSAKLLLKKNFAAVSTFEDPANAYEHLRFSPYDVVLLDMNFSRGETSGTEGFYWLKKIKQLRPQMVVIMVTAFGDVDIAIRAIKAGASDFVLKPWQNEKLLATVSAAYELSQSRDRVELLEARQRIQHEGPEWENAGLIGTSDAIKRVNQLIDKVAATDANVLVLGENGTGKEVVAKLIHKRSLRKNEVFVKVDLGAIPESLFESELFGHRKGAFTDAREDRTGRFEAAQGGTLFLDEIGNLSLPMQSKLLTTLQSKQVIRVGSNLPVDIDIRMICATNVPLHNLAVENRFRKDLLYRINTVEINLPPLKQRGSDIILLANHFLEQYSKKYQKTELKFSKTIEKALFDYPWPGNIRELQHAIERAVILADNATIMPYDLIPQNGAVYPVERIEKSNNLNLEEVEKQLINKALQQHNGNIS